MYSSAIWSFNFWIKGFLVKLGTLDSWYVCAHVYDIDSNLRILLIRLGMQDFMRRLGVDLLIQPEEDAPKIKETDQIQQRAVVSQICVLW